MWFYRGMLSIQWTEHVRKKEVLAKRETKRTLKQKKKNKTFEIFREPGGRGPEKSDTHMYHMMSYRKQERQRNTAHNAKLTRFYKSMEEKRDKERKLGRARDIANDT